MAKFNMRPIYQVNPDYLESTVKIRYFREQFFNLFCILGIRS